ncbi:MAG: hypothetical protein ABJC89_13715 [Acidobacteriota bacterium]
MLIDVVRDDSSVIARHWRPALLAGAVLLVAAPLRAQAPAPLAPVTVGAGMRTSFASTQPDGGDTTNDFALESVRLYVNGNPANKIKFEFNTEYDGSGNHVTVLDAVAKFELSGKFNIWAGRMLPPSDRANLYGPYYAHHWSVYTDGVQDGYPFVATGRDNGVAYWGQFDKVKVQAGVFDGSSATGKNDLITAGRVQVDFWDAEPGYYLNGTYYGGKNLLAIGAAGQVQDGEGAYSGDFLLEKKIAGGSSFTVEAELAKYDKLGGYSARYGTDTGGYVLGSYLFPPTAGMTGRFELLGKFAKANFSNGLTAVDEDYDQKTTEFNFNYVISDFKARVMFFFKNTTFSAVQTNFKQVGVGLQLQM